MINLMHLFKPSLALSMVVAGSVALLAAGCGEEEKPEVKAEPVQEVEPVAPQATSVAELIAKHNIDDRVFMDELGAPPDEFRRLAVLQFADVMVRGDVVGLKDFLDDIEFEEVQVLESRGEIAKLSSEIEEIEVLTGTSNQGEAAVLFLYEFSDRIVGQMWEELEGSEARRYRAAPVPPGLSEGLGADPFLDWYSALEEEQVNVSGDDLGFEAYRRLPSAQREDDGGGGGSGRSGGGGGSPGGR